MLLVAVVPAPLPITLPNATVDVALVDSEGAATCAQCFTYSDATITVTPDADLVDGQLVTVDIDGYAPAATVAIAQANPLIGVVQPRSQLSLPPQYVDPKSPPFATDANGDIPAERPPHR